MTLPKPRPGILDISPYVGGDSGAPGFERPIVLSSNESPLGPSPAAIAAIRGYATATNRYPDGDSHDLREAIGGTFGLDPARIVCGSGSDELIALLVRIFAGPGDEVLYSQYGFLMYRISALAAGATPVAAPESGYCADVEAILACVSANTRILFLANPNNPTGTYLTADELRTLRARLRDGVVLVVDAAYAEYLGRDDYSPGIDLVDANDNVVMTRTFSKIYGLAGLRLGWAYGPPAVVDLLNRVRGPFNVSAPAQVAGVAALSDGAFYQAARAHNDEWQPWLAREFLNLGLDVVPGVANFVLARFDDPGHGADAARAFLKEREILVRGMNGYGLPDCLRITIGLAADNRAVAAALAEFLGR
jgi:histidinol-phosphate aminotransferase